ncbi:MAG: transcriptional regulator [Deltaproteobacteria bacterium]|jgi:predicted DNA-binding transcriptional regulator YafY|nr:transcriptional regulator [Deltaproteobacteria bacterium]
MARGHQLARQWKIIQTLISSIIGKPASELAKDLHCHSRTVYRDLEALQTAGFPVYTDRVEGKNLWSLLDTAKHGIPIPFSLPELMALYFSRGMMGVLKDTVFYDSLVSLFDKIKATLPGECLKYLERFEKSLAVRSKPYQQYSQLPYIIGKVSEAAIQKKYIEMDYYTISRNQKTRRKVAPYKIWFFDGTFYLIGNCGLREDIRIFAMDRIQNFELTNEPFEMPKDFNVDDFMKSSFGIFHGERVRVSIWFAADIAAYIRERTWHETQDIETLKDSSIIFRAEVAGIAEIKFWILKWGAKAKVLKPESLRVEIQKEAEAMLVNYENLG